MIRIIADARVRIFNQCIEGDVYAAGPVSLFNCWIEGNLIAEDALPEFGQCYAEGQITHPDPTRVIACQQEKTA